jgi:hypothetical protein
LLRTTRDAANRAGARAPLGSATQPAATAVIPAYSRTPNSFGHHTSACGRVTMASSRLQQQLLLLLLLPAAASSSSTSFTVTVPECGHSDATSRAGSINQFWLSTAPAGQLINASQTTEANICFTEDGLEISLEAVERNVFSTAEECQAPVWEHGNALELFIAPVRGAWDIPAQYHEIDGAPSGAAWGSCIDAEAFCPGCANVTDVTCANDGEFTCTGGGLAEFTNGVVGNSVVSDDGWRFSLAVPWSIFADWAQPSTSGNSTLKMVPWPHWRLNLYRYNFFEGIEPDDYELDAWSPTHGPSFHDPRRFGYACLGPSGVCDRSVIIKTDDADAAALCNLNGSWSTLPEKIVHGFPEHIQFFQHPGEANFTLRTTDWGDVLSYGHVVDASHVDVFMVANPNGPPPITGSILRWTVSSTCDKMGSSWCRFPACPFKEPAHWPAWSPHPVPAPPAPAPAPPPPPHAPEKRVTCGGNYGWAVSAPACPPPQWEPAWALNLSTVTESAARTTGFYDPELASQWGVVTFDWADGAAIWQDRLPGHTGEEVLVEQSKRVKAMGTGTRCMVYRQNELAVQWQASSRSAMTQANADAGWFLQFKTRALCDGAAECADAAYHNKNGPGPIPPCKKPASRSEANCPYCCNFSSSNSTGAYNEPLGGPWRGSGPYNVTRFGNNTLGDGQLFWDFRRKDVQDYVAEKVFYGATTNAFVDGIFSESSSVPPLHYAVRH